MLGNGWAPRSAGFSMSQGPRPVRLQQGGAELQGREEQLVGALQCAFTGGDIGYVVHHEANFLHLTGNA